MDGASIWTALEKEVLYISVVALLQRYESLSYKSFSFIIEDLNDGMIEICFEQKKIGTSRGHYSFSLGEQGRFFHFYDT